MEILLQEKVCLIFEMLVLLPGLEIECQISHCFQPKKEKTIIEKKKIEILFIFKE